MVFSHWLIILTLIFSLTPLSMTHADPSRSETETALRKAVEFFSQKVAVRGGYVWCYSADLSKREGEGKVGSTTAWLQPPGTPFVGEGLLDIYELTGEEYALNAARETAMALVNGQLHSGGWADNIEFEPEARRRYAYRTDGSPGSKARNISTLDDDKTQSALRFLMRFDKITQFKEETIHEAVLFGLDCFIQAQFPNGGWAHAYEGPVDADQYPIQPASYRETGDDTRMKEYWRLYTLNDNLMSDVIQTLILAVRTYADERFLNAVKKAGDFLILAQMPEPQPGWAQQYDFEMHPAWARKFEPASISGGESQNIMKTLMDIYEFTGDRKYLSPIPQALAYYKRSLRSDGRLARFYELKTNRPLYFTKDYQLTYSDEDMPTHYAFIVSSNLNGIEKRYRSLSNSDGSIPKESKPSISRPSPESVHQIIDALDERGAWVEDGRLRYWGEKDTTQRIIHPRTFVRNAKVLAQYLYHLRT